MAQAQLQTLVRNPPPRMLTTTETLHSMNHWKTSFRTYYRRDSHLQGVPASRSPLEQRRGQLQPERGRQWLGGRGACHHEDRGGQSRGFERLFKHSRWLPPVPVSHRKNCQGKHVNARCLEYNLRPLWTSCELRIYVRLRDYQSDFWRDIPPIF